MPPFMHLRGRCQLGLKLGGAPFPVGATYDRDISTVEFRVGGVRAKSDILVRGGYFYKGTSSRLEQ